MTASFNSHGMASIGVYTLHLISEEFVPMWKTRLAAATVAVAISTGVTVGICACGECVYYADDI